MYVAVTGSGKYRVIQFREDVRLPGTTKKKINVIKTIGNYERILAEDPDAMEKLRAEAKRITEEKKSSNSPINFRNKILENSPNLSIPALNPSSLNKSFDSSKILINSRLS